jgi:hypothetical protein
MRACEPYAAHHVIAARNDLLNLDAQIGESTDHHH